MVMVRMTKVTAFLLVALQLLLPLVAGQDPELELSFNRQGEDLNIITLRCRDRVEFSSVVDAVFRMDGSFIDESIQGYEVLQPGIVQFVLSPEIESVLTCESIGTGRVSNELSIAALRLRQEFEDREVTVAIGEQVEIPCDYQPGNLRELYQIDWIQFLASGAFRILRPETLDVQQPEIHLSINPDTYSLTVMALSTSQNGNGYQCRVRIRSIPEVTNGFTYVGALNRLNAQDLTLRFVNDTPRVEANSVMAQFVTGSDIRSVVCDLSTQLARDCTSGQVSFTDLPPDRTRAFNLTLEGIGPNGRLITLSRTFRTETTGQCWLHLINDGITVTGDSVRIEWQGTGPSAENRVTSYTCKLDGGRTETCSNVFQRGGLVAGTHSLRVKPVGADCTRRRKRTFSFEITA